MNLMLAVWVVPWNTSGYNFSIQIFGYHKGKTENCKLLEGGINRKQVQGFPEIRLSKNSKVCLYSKMFQACYGVQADRFNQMRFLGFSKIPLFIINDFDFSFYMFHTLTTITHTQRLCLGSMHCFTLRYFIFQGHLSDSASVRGRSESQEAVYRRHTLHRVQGRGRRGQLPKLLIHCHRKWYVAYMSQDDHFVFSTLQLAVREFNYAETLPINMLKPSIIPTYIFRRTMVYQCSSPGFLVLAVQPGSAKVSSLSRSICQVEPVFGQKQCWSTCDGQIKVKPGSLWKTITDDLNSISVCLWQIRMSSEPQNNIFNQGMSHGSYKSSMAGVTNTTGDECDIISTGWGDISRQCTPDRLWSVDSVCHPCEKG